MRKKVSFILLGLLILSLTYTPMPVHASYGMEVDSIIADYDGYVRDDLVNDTTGNIVLGGNNGTKVFRGWFSFQLDDIPDTAMIVNVSFLYNGQFHASDCELREMAVNASTVNGTDLYNYAGNGTVIYNTAGFPVAGANQTAQLGVNRDAYCQSLEALIASGRDWYSIGFRKINEGVGDGGNINQINSMDNAVADPKPTLYVEYYDSGFVYVFTDAYYENGTSTDSVIVNVAGDGYSDSFNTSGGTTQYYTPEPEAFYWDIGGGLIRYLYSFGSENFTVTIPESTAYSYGFIIKDYTGKSGLGDSYLEAYRVINGTELLIERVKITQPNPAPLSLTYGRTYHIQILYADATRYDWGYFLAGSDTSNTIIARSTSFTDQAHMIYQTIRVEATRSADGGTITVDYNDTRDNTVWANVTITQRGGGVMLQAARNNSTYTLNWASANASLGYIVSVTGEHDDYGEWGYVMMFDPSETFPATPNLTGIFDIGLGANLGGWVITVAAMLGFSKTLKTRALLVGSAVATLLNYIGFANWTTNQLIFSWFFSIAVALAGGSE